MIPHDHGRWKSGGRETRLTHWKFFGGVTYSSDSRIKCFKFVFFRFCGYLGGMLATLSMIHHPHEKIRGNAPAKQQLAKPPCWTEIYALPSVLYAVNRLMSGTRLVGGYYLLTNQERIMFIFG